MVCPLWLRNAATFILPVPYVSDFSITVARYFTGNLRVANGVHNEAEMAWRTDGPDICLPSVPFFFPRPPFLPSASNTRLFSPPLSPATLRSGDRYSLSRSDCFPLISTRLFFEPLTEERHSSTFTIFNQIYFYYPCEKIELRVFAKDLIDP